MAWSPTTGYTSIPATGSNAYWLDSTYSEHPSERGPKSRHRFFANRTRPDISGPQPLPIVSKLPSVPAFTAAIQPVKSKVWSSLATKATSTYDTQRGTFFGRASAATIPSWHFRPTFMRPIVLSPYFSERSTSRSPLDPSQLGTDLSANPSSPEKSLQALHKDSP
jgi:hypothetical protein